MAKRKFSFDDHFASRIVRVIGPKQDYLCALVHRKYDDIDVDTIGGGEWIGYKLVPQYRKISDNDPESETYGKRIDDPSQEPIGNKPQFDFETNEKNIKEFKKLVGNTVLGETIFVLRIDNSAYRAGNIEQFWTGKPDDLRTEYTTPNRTVVIKDETKKSK